MGEMITKPDTNPIIILVANLFTFGFLGYFLIGQTKKAVIMTIAFFVANCMFLGWVFLLLGSYDAYLLAQKLQNGESIGQNENGLSFLDAVFKD